MMRKKFKKALAVVLAATTVCSMLVLGGCGKSGGDTQTGQNNGNSAVKKEAVEVTDPVTIRIWHSSGAGANGEYMDAAIKAFNESNEYGITVEGTYVGPYKDTLSRVSTSIAAKENPVLAVLGDVGIPVLSTKGALADMTPYVERDNFNMDNFLESLQPYCTYEDQIVSFPFNRSTSLLFYNKAIWGKAGMEPSDDLTELFKQAEAITKANPGVYGFGAHSDPFYFQEAWVRSLGSEGLTTNGGNSAGALDDGNLERVFTDWLAAIEGKYVATPSVTDAENKMKEAFYQGKIASIVASSGGLSNIIEMSKESGIDLGVSFMPSYGGTNTICGGGNIVVIQSNHSDQEISAAWEFIKFLSTDEWVAKRACGTGYVPVTYTSVEREEVKNLWAEQPAYKAAYDGMQYAESASWSIYQSEWNTYLEQATSYVIQDQTMTPAEAVDYLKKQATIIFE